MYKRSKCERKTGKQERWEKRVAPGWLSEVGGKGKRQEEEARSFQVELVTVGRLTRAGQGYAKQ